MLTTAHSRDEIDQLFNNGFLRFNFSPRGVFAANQSRNNSVDACQLQTQDSKEGEKLPTKFAMPIKL